MPDSHQTPSQFASSSSSMAAGADALGGAGSLSGGGSIGGRGNDHARASEAREKPGFWKQARRTAAKAFSPLASLKLTIVLLLALIVLIFCGTWAQRSQGIWVVMDQYFRSWLVMIPLDIFHVGGPNSSQIPGQFPWPGGASIGLALLINLIAAHAVRFKVKARGLRLAAGLTVLAIGVGLIVAFTVTSIIPTLRTQAGYLPMLVVGLLFYLPAVIGTAIVFGKRFGIVLIHSSLILLLVGEGVTRTMSLETQMPIYQGQTVNFSQDMREVELAVIEPEAAGEGQEHVVSIPQAMLVKAAKTGKPIRTQALPFSIDVERWMRNSTFSRRRRAMGAMGAQGSVGPRDMANMPNMPASHPAVAGQRAKAGAPRHGSKLAAHSPVKPPADMHGLGRMLRLQPKAEVSGVGGQNVNFPGAVIELIKSSNSNVNDATSQPKPNSKANPKSEPSADQSKDLGSFIVSARTMTMGTLYETHRQPLTVNGRKYELSLRFRRHYHPFAFTLNNFEHTNYPGTTTPSSYASTLQLVNPKAGEDRPVRVEMNEPLRYGGQTFYQSGYIPGDRGTILQVVANPASGVPYIACAVGGIGLLCHFCMSLARFMGKGRRK